MMKFSTACAWIFACGAGAAAPSSGASVAAVPTHNVTLPTGVVRGTQEGDVRVWRGIPYATPPEGPYRWRAPQPAPHWKGVIDATKFGPDCAQDYDPAHSPLRVTPAEDCLYLNVWSPPHAGRLPVMVWIYGGGFTAGGTSEPAYDGVPLAHQGVVVVSINYRLGRFGFFAHPALSAAYNQEPKGDYGLMDQIAALEWVKENIARFGGDPSQVTIFGQSAGGGSVDYLLMNPDAKGLFQRAIVQSGGGREGAPFTRPLSGAASAEEAGVAFAGENGISGSGEDALIKLRALPVTALTPLKGTAFFDEQADYAGMIDDEHFAHAHWVKQFESGTFNHVPVLIGSTTADGRPGGADTEDALFGRFGAAAAQARTAYDPDGKTPLKALNQAVGSDEFMAIPAKDIASAISAHGAPVYLYRFGYVAQAMKAGWTAGAPHASEVPYVFGTLTQSNYGAHVQPQDLAVSNAMLKLWSNFAKNGRPSAPGVPVWKAYDPKRDELLTVDEQGAWHFGRDPLHDRLALTKANAP